MINLKIKLFNLLAFSASFSATDKINIHLYFLFILFFDIGHCLSIINIYRIKYLSNLFIHHACLKYSFIINIEIKHVGQLLRISSTKLIRAHKNNCNHPLTQQHIVLIPKQSTQPAQYYVDKYITKTNNLNNEFMCHVQNRKKVENNNLRISTAENDSSNMKKFDVYTSLK